MPLPFWNFVLGVIRLRCLVCLKGEVFDGLFKAQRSCGHCGYFFARESGYFLGSAYIGYGATIGVAIVTWFILGYLMGLGWGWPVLAVLLLVVSVFPIWFFRYSRMLWMALDMYLNPPVKEDFEARGR